MGASPGPASPFLICADAGRAAAFYRDYLGFEIRFAPGDAPFFAIVGKDSAQLFLKSEEGVTPQPNRLRGATLRWDAFIYAADPDALADDVAARGVTFAVPLQTTHDGLRGFEIDDLDGYRLFFGRPA
ncbi:MAG: VOC family protein [Sphingomonas sp.]